MLVFLTVIRCLLRCTTTLFEMCSWKEFLESCHSEFSLKNEVSLEVGNVSCRRLLITIHDVLNRDSSKSLNIGVGVVIDCKAPMLRGRGLRWNR